MQFKNLFRNIYGILMEISNYPIYSRINTFLDMHVDNVDTNNIYIATNSTNVLHATCIGNRPNPLMYKQDEMSMS